jgi:hypothetical protein
VKFESGFTVVRLHRLDLVLNNMNEAVFPLSGVLSGISRTVRFVAHQKNTDDAEEKESSLKN